MNAAILSDIVDVFDSKRKPLSTMTRAHMKGNIPYYSANGIIDYINQSSFCGEYILIAEDGSVKTEDNHPVIKLTKPGERFWVSNHAHVIRAKNGINSKYLFYNLSCININQCITGAVQLKVSQENLLRLEVVLHSPEQQQHIVGTIGSVDSLIEKNEETIDKANNIIGHYFEIIPVVSTTTKLKDVFQITIGRTPPTKEHQWFSNGGLGSVPWLSIKDMDSNTTFLTKTSQYLTEEAVERFNIPLVEENDVLLSFKLTVGRVEISSIRMVTNEAIACFKADAYLRNYLYCYLKKCNFLSDGDNTSSIGQAVNSTIIKNFPFSVPTNASLAQFNEKTMPLFKLVMEKQKENILLKREKQALLIRYFGSH